MGANKLSNKKKQLVNKNKIFTYRMNNNIALKVFRCLRAGIIMKVLKAKKKEGQWRGS
jgi:hypothetical protein